MENVTEKKKIVFSAIQPSGTITLGNYLGAVRNWVKMQDNPDYNCLYALADLHTITVRQEPAQMRRNIIDAYAMVMACGVDGAVLHPEPQPEPQRDSVDTRLLHPVRRAQPHDPVQG